MATTLETTGGWPAILTKVLSGQDLTTDEAAAALDDVLDGSATPAQIAAFVAGLRTKGRVGRGDDRPRARHAEPR